MKQKFATAEQLLHSQIRRELPAIQVGPAPKVRRIAPALPAAVVGIPSCSNSSNSNTSRAVSPLHSACMALVHRWVACCSSVTPALASSPWGGALVGVDKQPQLALGVCALERLGAILMEQDRVKALFLREVTSALSSHLEKHLVPPTTPSLPLLRETDVLVSSLVHKHRGVAEEVVRRQQLDLQGACAVDAVVRGGFTSTATLSSGTSGGGSGGGAGCWGDAFKVCFRHSGAFDSALQLQGAIRGMLSTAPVADSAR